MTENTRTVVSTGIIQVYLYGDFVVMRILNIALISSIFIWFSCTVREVLSVEDNIHGNIGSEEESGIGEGEASKGKVYVTGVEFPLYYDWASSVEQNEEEEALIFLMADGVRVTDFLAGRKHGVYTDPSRHRFVNGHIYSDFNIEGRTLVKRDGELLFSYDTEETVVAWAVMDGEVYTLARREGKGAYLRKNGVLHYESHDADILSGLYDDGPGVGFCAGKNRKRCSVDIYSDGKVMEYLCPEGLDSVLVAEKIGDDLVYVGYSSETDEYMLSCGYRSVVLERYLYDYISEFRILRGQNCFFIYGERSDKNDNLCSPAVWTADGLYLDFSVYDKCFSICADSDTLYSFVGVQQYPQGMHAYKDRKELFDCGSWMTVRSDRASAVSEGKLYFIYEKSRPYLHPCLSVDGDETQYGFNGFFSGISVWQPVSH